ncbi:MAG: heavy-metal-associated domain-containing protein [Intrasporangium sp.]|uniref:heavy metal-associated domain-containing protein n=1 Tax=Intrasporangium sp. TaxID=1925024 RepID=UPI0026493B87|nr:heavy metal-associated domain-containing protein [Intrasporangium sp.]MDN5798158.1 heavy-metal-associated domain-containing protein [Intrasporangium sp.]
MSVREYLDFVVRVLARVTAGVIAVLLALGVILALAAWATGAGWLMWFWLPGSAVIVLLLFVLIEAVRCQSQPFGAGRAPTKARHEVDGAAQSAAGPWPRRRQQRGPGIFSGRARASHAVASCANRIEKKLNRLDGARAGVNYAPEKARVAILKGRSGSGFD